MYIDFHYNTYIYFQIIQNLVLINNHLAYVFIASSE